MKKVIALIMTLALLTAGEYTILKTKGIVKIIAGKKISPAQTGAKLDKNNFIKTYSDSWAEVRLPDGSTARIGADKNIKVALLNKKGRNKTTLIQSLFKLSKKDKYNMTSPTGVAGVRGSEKGKMKFKPKFAGNTAESRKATVQELQQGKILFGKEQYQQAIVKLKSFIKANPDADKTGEAMDLITLCYLELSQYQDALKAAATGLNKTDNQEIKESLRYAKITALFFLSRFADILTCLEDTPFAENSNYYWQAQIIKYYSLVNTDEMRAARRLKRDIQSDCPDTAIINKIAD
ncbi:MAG TPA: hypothetical protein VKS21_12280 [Spirochaetota bacterium]|nr:hypothetical protein [Spirochaetota bacterium]